MPLRRRKDPSLLLVAPYYNKPNQEGLFRHFAAAAKITDKPIILYSIPGRSVIEIAIPTVRGAFAQKGIPAHYWTERFWRDDRPRHRDCVARSTPEFVIFVGRGRFP